MIRLTGHAQQKMAEREIDETEVIQTIATGELVETTGSRLIKRLLFARGYHVEERFYPHKEVTVVYVEEAPDTVVITAIARYGRWEIK